MKIRNSFTRLIVIPALLLSFPNVVFARTMAPKPSQTGETSTAKVIQLLQESGYLHRKTGENTWLIERQGKSPILLATGAEFVVLGIVVAVKKNIRASGDLNFKLLKLNHSLDYVKAGFDDDDDLFVRVELRIRTVDLQAFKLMVEDVIDGADKALEVVTPFLLTP